jgi:WD40 repeat protein
MTPEYGAYVKKLEELQLPVSKPTCSSFNPKMKWVYGIRTEDVSEPVKCITSCNDKAANEKLIYFIGKVAVVYYPKLSMQQHYTEHHQEISCLVISKNSVLAASGELSTKPNLHIWEVKTLSTVTILRNHHRTPISHLMFLKSDKLLISSSFREAQSSILVHSLEDETVLFSCYLTDTIVSILPLLALSTTETSNLSFGSENSSASSTLDN